MSDIRKVAVITGASQGIGAGLVDETTTTTAVVAAALIGAIAWDLVTWWFGLPSSSSHALIGGLFGATLVAAGMYDLYKHRALFDARDTGMFAVGFAISFVSAFLCIRWLLRFIATHDFTLFAWYRIAFGFVVLATAYFGWVDWSQT